MIDPVTADWLRTDGLRIVANNAAAAAWGDIAVDSMARCPFDDAADADAEGDRQIAFFGPARAIERLRVEGRQAALLGQVVTLTADVEGYRTGADVFVIGVSEIEGDSGTELLVIRRQA